MTECNFAEAASRSRADTQSCKERHAWVNHCFVPRIKDVFFDELPCERAACFECGCSHPQGRCECVGTDTIDRQTIAEFLRLARQPQSVYDCVQHAMRFDSIVFSFDEDIANLCYIASILTTMGFVPSRVEVGDVQLVKLIPYGAQYAEITVNDLELAQCSGDTRECVSQNFDAIASKPVRLMTSNWRLAKANLAHDEPYWWGCVASWMVDPRVEQLPPADRDAECQAGRGDGHGGLCTPCNSPVMSVDRVKLRSDPLSVRKLV